MIIVPFIPAHLIGMKVQAAQENLGEAINYEWYGEQLAASGVPYTVFKDDVIMGCGGLVDQGGGRALAWTLLSDQVRGMDMVTLTRIVRWKMDQSGYRRIEAVVKVGFDAGERWLKLLGFRNETPDGMEHWFPNGSKGYLMARVTP